MCFPGQRLVYGLTFYFLLAMRLLRDFTFAPPLTRSMSALPPTESPFDTESSQEMVYSRGGLWVSTVDEDGCKCW